MARSTDNRPNPDELLRRVVAEERQQQRGKLTVFFGAAPGVGKTYAMLEVARNEMEREKRDVVVGIVETHGRYETGALTLGLELLPRRRLTYRGVELEEFDLDAALARRPDLVLVDELAHTNAEGSRHPKRWQDVEELLEAGIDVFSTLNVQHVESLNDVIARITGVVVRETVPDSVLEAAHAIKLVDLPPEDLLERLREGKVYVPAQAQRAIENFFRKGNLIALRELALRHTAERVDAEMRAYRQAQGIEQTWAAMEQMLVAVSPSPHSARLVRAARRMAAALHARWYAVYVEPLRVRPLSSQAQTRLSQNLRLAEQLGAEVITLSGDNPSQALVRFAREHNVTKLIVGKPVALRVWDRLGGSFVDHMLRLSGDIDVYVTAGDPDAHEPAAPEPQPTPAPELSGYAAALLSAAVSSSVAWFLFGRRQLADVVMVYLLGVVIVSTRVGLGASLLAALVGVAAFDFLFVPPYLTFAVADFSHIVTFFVMFLVAVVISGLTQRVRNQAAAWRERERRTAALYALSRELARASDTEQVMRVAAAQLEKVFDARVEIFLPEGKDSLRRAHASSGLTENPERELSLAGWVFQHRKEAGLGTATLPGGGTLYVPLVSGGGVGVLGLTPTDRTRFDELEQRRQVDAFAAQLAMAVERAELSEETTRARRKVETEELRSSLLSSVSHDLRTPLAVITGAAGTLLETPSGVDAGTRRELMQTILDESERLNRLIGNLLDMTRLESGAVTVKKEWTPLEEPVGAALDRLESRLASRELHVNVPRGLPLVPCDASLIEQALINLLENAVKYASDPIEIRVTPHAGEVLVEVADRGPGIPAGEELKVFERFHRAGHPAGAGGVGLGLAICRAIVAAHGGRIWVQNREGGGAAFRFTLPIEGRPPAVLSSPPCVEASA